MDNNRLIQQIKSETTSRLYSKYPFFGAFLFQERMRIKTISDADFAEKNARAYTNCNDVIGVHPGWLNSLHRDVACFVLAHEILHIIHRHDATRGHRNPTLWNVACDYYINSILFSAFPEAKKRMTPHITVDVFIDGTNTDAVSSPDMREEAVKTGKYSTLPDAYACMYDEQIDIDEMSAADIYNMLLNKLPPDQKQAVEAGEELSKAIASAMAGDISSTEDGEACEASTDAIDKAVADAVRRAAATAKAIGTQSANLNRHIDALINRKQPFTEVLNNLILRHPALQNSAKHDYTRYTPMSATISSITRRASVYPGRRKKREGEAVVAIDTSASISDEDLANAAAVFEKLRDSGKFKTLTVLHCDAEICAVEQFTKRQRIKLNPKGGGGTSFVPVFEWINENKPNTDLLVYITDGYGEFPSKTGTPTIWCISNDSVTPPFGQLIRV